jgi:hypothetical protein
MRVIFGAPALWALLLFVAVWWPSRFIGPLDGVPLDRVFEAIALGLALPWLAWLGRDALQQRGFRALVVALLAWKAGTSLATQQGLCANTQAPQPLVGSAFTMRIEEPRGYLRSWDLRADLWSDEPACTAILTRSLHATEEFPAWFVNITDQMMGRREFTMHVHGYVTRHGEAERVEQTLALGSEPWSFNPMVDGSPLWEAALVTASTPTAFDRVMAPWAWLVAPALSLALLVLLLNVALTPLWPQPRTVAWVVAGTVLAVVVATAPIDGLNRAAGLLTLGAVVTWHHWDHRSLNVAAWTVGAPWLAFFAAWSAPLVGRVSAYSEDDWLAYQIAGYRIYMNGHWVEGGTPTFDYQPLYRWVTGALHLVFGDASVGEMYWDASWLLVGALVAFTIVRARAGVRWATVAAALTLATVTLGTPWYVIGRGLSEITAAGFGFLAVVCVMHARQHGARWMAAGALCAGLMFYARLNQLLWAPLLVAMVLPLAVGSDIAGLRAALGQVKYRLVALYLAGFGLALVAFMARTRYFTGVFSLFHGTALRHNDTGLRPWSVLDVEVWTKVGHSLAGFVFMNEPPRPDVRTLVVAAGITVAVLAALQFPVVRRVPAALVLVTLGSVAGAFVAHSHGYPGRFTVHVVPFASAVIAIAASTITSGFTGSDWRVSHSKGTCTPVT